MLWYRQIHSTSWVVYRNNTAQYEATTEHEILVWLFENGHTQSPYRCDEVPEIPLRVAKF